MGPYRRGSIKRIRENAQTRGCGENLPASIASEFEWAGMRSEIIAGAGVLAYIWGEEKGGTALVYVSLEKEKYVDCTAAVVTAATEFFDRREKLAGDLVFFFRLRTATEESDQKVADRLADLRLTPDIVLAVGEDSGLCAGEFSVASGTLKPAELRFSAEIEGSGGHGSSPALCLNPIDVFVPLSAALAHVGDRREGCMYVPGNADAGTAGNIIPQTLEFGGSFFCADDALAENTAADFEKTLRTIAAAYGVECRVKTGERFGTKSDSAQHRIYCKNILSRTHTARPAGLGEKIFLPDFLFRADVVLVEFGSRADEQNSDLCAEHAYEGVCACLEGLAALGAGVPENKGGR